MRSLTVAALLAILLGTFVAGSRSPFAADLSAQSKKPSPNGIYLCTPKTADAQKVLSIAKLPANNVVWGE